MKKLLSLATILALMIVTLTAVGFTVGASYDTGDVDVIKKIIEDNELSYDVSDPSTWDFATWWGGRVVNLILNDKNLTTLDVSALTNLQILYCNKNALTTLDVSSNAALQRLECSENKLTSLLLNNPLLDVLNCSNNELETIDLSKNTAMTWIDVSINDFDTVDVSKNTAVTSLGVSENNLTEIDISKNVALKSLACNDNELTTLDFSGNPNIDTVIASNNKITEFSVKGMDSLIYIELEGNPLEKFESIDGGKVESKDAEGGIIDLIGLDSDNTYYFEAKPDENCSFLKWIITDEVVFEEGSSLTTREIAFKLKNASDTIEITALFSQLPTVEKPEFANITKDSVDVSGKYELNEGTFVADSEAARYRAVGETEWTDIAEGLEYKDGTISFSITGLKADTEYEVEVYVENENGGVWSEASTFTTLEDEPAESSEETSPETGDTNNTIAIMIILVLACGAIAISRKRIIGTK